MDVLPEYHTLLIKIQRYLEEKKKTIKLFSFYKNHKCNPDRSHLDKPI